MKKTIGNSLESFQKLKTFADGLNRIQKEPSPLIPDGLNRSTKGTVPYDSPMIPL